MIKNDEYQIVDYAIENDWMFLNFFQDIFSEMGFEFDIDGKDADIRNIPERYQTGSGIFWGLKFQEDIIGSLALSDMSNGAFELKRFYILEAHRQKGLGNILLGKALEHASKRNAKRVLLDTTPKSERAISMFRKRGFKDIDRYNDDPYAEIWMELKL